MHSELQIVYLAGLTVEQLREVYRNERRYSGLERVEFDGRVKSKLVLERIPPTPLNYVIAACEVTAEVLEREEAMDRAEEEAAWERARQDSIEAEADAWHDQFE